MNVIERESTASPRVAATETPQELAAIFYPRLEAIRGIAVLVVAAFHSWQSTWFDSAGQARNFMSQTSGGSIVENLGPLVLRVVGNGSGAVVLFFVISGFVLSASLVRGPQNLAAGASRFLIARLFRIYPAVFATIAIFAVLFWTTGAFISGRGGYTPLGLLQNALLLDISIDGVMWSLRLELVAIPLIFIAYRGWRRWGAVALAAPFYILATLSFWGPWNWAIGAPNLFGEIHAFILGMAAFLAAPHLVERCSPRIATITFAGAAALLVASRPVLGFTSNWSALAEALFGAIAVAMLAFGRARAFGSMFDLRLIRFFGRISYSLYLLHPLSLMIMWKFPNVLAAIMATGVPPIVLATLLFIVSVAAVTPLAWAMYRWVELPGIARGRKQGWAAGRPIPRRPQPIREGLSN